MDWSLTAIIAMASGTVLGYAARMWGWLYWKVTVPLDIMYILIKENKDKNGFDFKFSEDKVDILNPSEDSGMLMNKAWVLSYNIQGKKESNQNFSFFGGSDTTNLIYSLSCLRVFRKKILNIINNNEKSSERENKIFIVNASSIYYVGEINETNLELPPVIEEKLNGDRTTRLNIFLHGDVGTGKTTMVRAIAHKLGMPIYILAINAWWDVTDFIRALQKIPDDSVILLDDIDLTLEQLLRASIEKGSSSIPLKFSTSSLMAFLDGIFMKEKRWIVAMCTNRPKEVTELLRLRPGRVHINYECTEKHENDYVEASQVAEKLITKYRAEKAEKSEKAEKVVEEPHPV